MPWSSIHHTLQGQRLVTSIWEDHRYALEIPDLGIPSCAMALSAMGLKLRVFRIFQTSHGNHKTIVLIILAGHAAFEHVYLHAWTAVCAGDIRTWWTTVSLIMGKNPKARNLNPMLRSKWRRFWDLPCIPEGSVQLKECKLSLPVCEGRGGEKCLLDEKNMDKHGKKWQNQESGRFLHLNTCWQAWLATLPIIGTTVHNFRYKHFLNRFKKYQQKYLDTLFKKKIAC